MPRLPRSLLTRLTIVATSGCTAAVSDTNEPPVVTLADVSELRAGQAITLSATFLDDTTTPEAAVWTWTADPGGELDGVFTTTADGATLNIEDGFEPGDYQVSVTALDEGGIAGADLIGFNAKDDKSPHVTFHEPRQNFEYADTLPLLVSADVLDRDDDASSITLAWSGIPEDSDAPTSAGAGGTVIFSVNIGVGEHTIVATATDPLGATEDDFVDFTVLRGDVDGDGDTTDTLGGNDCDDTDEDVHPGARETCDDVDNDCDGDIDEDCAR